MRVTIVGLCFAAAACGGQALTSPASPSGAPAAASVGAADTGSARTQAHGGTELPFEGSFTTATSTPPPLANATLEGTAAHLGRFSGVLTAEVDLATNTSTGTFDFTTANGDHVAGTFVGVEGLFIPPNTGRITEVATITHATGRFTGVSGTFTMVRYDHIDFSTGTATGSGSLAGHLSMNR
jgi:hypothetical protein